MLRVMVRYSNHEVLDGSANHHECSYEPRGDTWAIRVTSAQDRICLDYFCWIGVNYARMAVSLISRLLTPCATVLYERDP